MNGKPDKWIPALIGGAFLGLATTLPGIKCGCCLWLIGAGFLAVFVYRQRNPGLRMSTGDGALLGLMTAVVGAIVSAVVSGLLLASGAGVAGLLEGVDQLTQTVPDFPQEAADQARSLLESLGVAGVVMIGALFNLVIFSIFSTLGGILGVAILQKNPPQAPPPQWSQTPPPPPPADGGVS